MKTLFIPGLLAPRLKQPGGFAQEFCRACFERMKRAGIEFDQAQKKANDLIATKSSTGEACPVAMKSLRILDAYNATNKDNMDCIPRDQSVYRSKNSYHDKYKKNQEPAAANRNNSAKSDKGHFGKNVERPSWNRMSSQTGAISSNHLIE